MGQGETPLGAPLPRWAFLEETSALREDAGMGERDRITVTSGLEVVSLKVIPWATLCFGLSQHCWALLNSAGGGRASSDKIRAKPAEKVFCQQHHVDSRCSPHLFYTMCPQRVLPRFPVIQSPLQWQGLGIKEMSPDLESWLQLADWLCDLRQVPASIQTCFLTCKMTLMRPVLSTLRK